MMDVKPGTAALAAILDEQKGTWLVGMAEMKEMPSLEYCCLPMCTCGLERRLAVEHKLYHILDSTKYSLGSAVNNVYGVSVDQPKLDVFLAKRKLQQPLDPEEYQAYMPITYDKVSPSEIFLENDIRIRDSAARSAQQSTLTSMLPLKPVPAKKKESEWGSYQDMSCEYSTNPQSPGTYRSMMTRFRDAMIIAKIPTFRTEAFID